MTDGVGGGCGGGCGGSCGGTWSPIVIENNTISHLQILYSKMQSV